MRLGPAAALARLTLADIERPATMAALADAMGVHPATVRRGLRDLAAHDLADHTGALWRNTNATPASLTGRWGAVPTTAARQLAGRPGLAPWLAALCSILGRDTTGTVTATRLAAVAGTHRRSAQRALRDLVAAGVIARDASTVTLTDAQNCRTQTADTRKTVVPTRAKTPYPYKETTDLEQEKKTRVRRRGSTGLTTACECEMPAVIASLGDGARFARCAVCGNRVA